MDGLPQLLVLIGEDEVPTAGAESGLRTADGAAASTAGETEELMAPR